MNKQPYDEQRTQSSSYWAVIGSLLADGCMSGRKKDANMPITVSSLRFYFSVLALVVETSLRNIVRIRHGKSCARVAPWNHPVVFCMGWERDGYRGMDKTARAEERVRRLPPTPLCRQWRHCARAVLPPAHLRTNLMLPYSSMVAWRQCGVIGSLDTKGLSADSTPTMTAGHLLERTSGDKDAWILMLVIIIRDVSGKCNR